MKRPAAFAALALLALVVVAMLARFARGARVAHVLGGAAATRSGAACFPPAMAAQLLKAARGRSRGFAPPTAADGRRHAAAARRLAAKHGVAVPERTLASMHTQARAERARRRTSGGAARWDAKIRGAKGRPAAVAAALDLPPMFVVRRLAALGLAASAEEEGEAARADAGSAHHQRTARARADAYEAEVGRDLAAAGATFRTEAELRAAGERLTPDFRLDVPLRIAGKPVAWIDAKNYAYYGCRLTLPGLRRQARKYTAAYGPGAMVFAGGVACGAPELGALVLGPRWAAEVE